MKAHSGGESPNLTVLESVRCLECGAIYAKPSGGGTVQENPGCPDCGYVGWVDVRVVVFSELWMLFYFDVDRLLYWYG